MDSPVRPRLLLDPAPAGDSSDSPKSSPRAERLALGSARAMVRSSSTTQIQSVRVKMLADLNPLDLAIALDDLRCTVATASKRPNPVNRKFLTELLERIDKVDGFISARVALQDPNWSKKLIQFAADEKQVEGERTWSCLCFF